MIPRFSSISRLHRVPVPHTNDAVYALTRDGGRWIAKREAEMGFEAMLAEAVTWLLGRAIEAPLPGAAFCDDPGRTWLSACVPQVRHWSPGLANRVANPRDVGAMLCLDAWVLNEARHARNLLAQALETGEVRVWAIDADEALVGHIDDYIARGNSPPSVHNHARGLPIPALAEGARSAALRATRLSHAELALRTEEACTIAREPRASELADAIAERAGALPGIVEHYLQTLEDLE